MTQGNLIGVTDAAAALGLNASTVSRYLAKHPELNRAPGGRRPQVDLEELREHRESTLVIAESSGAPLAAPAAPTPGPREAKTGREGPSYADSRAARESVRAYKERLELDEMLGRLVPQRPAGCSTAGSEARRNLSNDLAAASPIRGVRERSRHPIDRCLPRRRGSFPGLKRTRVGCARRPASDLTEKAT